MPATTPSRIRRLLGSDGWTEAQGVQDGDRARAHREDVAQDPAHAGGGALVGLDERRVVVRLDLEDGGEAVADVHRARVLSRPLDDTLSRGGERLQVALAALVGAVLGPHHREEPQLRPVGLPAEGPHDAVVLLGGQVVLGKDFRRDAHRPPAERFRGRHSNLVTVPPWVRTILLRWKIDPPMNLIHLAIPVFFLLIAVELVAARLLEKDVYRLSDSVSDLSCGILDQIVGVFLKTALFAGYVAVYDHFRLFSLPNDSVAAWVACFLGVDLFYYCSHRFSHEVNAGWATHIVHHQSEELNLAVALRQSAFGQIYTWIFYLPLALLGFPPLMFLTLNAANTLYQFWVHTRLIGKLGPMEWVFNTPSHHRVHHARNPQYIDKNHAGTLIVWDRLFGTFAEEKEECCLRHHDAAPELEPRVGELPLLGGARGQSATDAKPGGRPADLHQGARLAARGPGRLRSRPRRGRGDLSKIRQPHPTRAPRLRVRAVRRCKPGRGGLLLPERRLVGRAENHRRPSPGGHARQPGRAPGPKGLGDLARGGSPSPGDGGGPLPAELGRPRRRLRRHRLGGQPLLAPPPALGHPPRGRRPACRLSGCLLQVHKASR